jgi:curved DNA-binding protein CbpA
MDEIWAAFHRLKKKFDPEISVEVDANERFRELNDALEILIEPTRRARYDQSSVLSTVHTETGETAEDNLNEELEAMLLRESQGFLPEMNFENLRKSLDSDFHNLKYSLILAGTSSLLLYSFSSHHSLVLALSGFMGTFLGGLLVHAWIRPKFPHAIQKGPKKLALGTSVYGGLLGCSAAIAAVGLFTRATM